MYKWGAASRERDAYRLLVREIHHRGLGPGDRLPPQEALRQELGFSHFTLSRAMERLVADGVVERKTKIGTVVVDPDASDLSAWTVALLLNWDMGASPSPFYARLTCLLQCGLAAAECHCRAYPRKPDKPDTRGRLEGYQGLSEDIEAGLVDAVLTPGDLNHDDRISLAALGIPVCFSTSWELATCGAVIDGGRFAREAVELLGGMGMRRFALVESYYGPGCTLIRDCARAAVSGLPGCSLDLVNTNMVGGVDGGRFAAALLQARPRNDRPDCLIIGDDHIALGLAQVLEAETDHSPAIAVLTHKAAPLAFADPVLRFELDDAQLAATAVGMMIKRLRNPRLPDCVEWMAARLADEDFRHTPVTPAYAIAR